MEEEAITEFLDIKVISQCRICLSCDNEIVDIFQVLAESDTKSVQEFFEESIGIEVSENDGLTTLLCKNCYVQLTESISLRRKARESELKLRQQCRICMSCDIEGTSDFDIVLELMEGKKTLLREVLEETTGINVSSDNGLTRFLCQACVQRLRNSATLRFQAEESIQRLKETQVTVEEVFIDQISQADRESIKSEPADADIDNGSVYSPKSAKSELSEESSNEEEAEFKPKRKIISRKRGRPLKRPRAILVEDRDYVKGGPYVCQICKKIFENPSLLKRHLITHTNSKPYSCGTCSKEFTGSASLKRHILAHANERTYTCKTCSKAFNSIIDLRRHSLTHNKKRTFICDICAKTFTTMAHLRGHIRGHNNERPFACQHCPKAFSISSALNSHLRVHSDIRPFSCTICSSAFRTAESLKCHMRVHTKEKPYVCKFCDRGFSEAITLTRHIRTHTNERPFVCEVCGRAFAQAGNLRQHMMVHTKERPFVCDVCAKSFNRGTNYKSHLLTHSTQRPYVCPICNKGFTVPRDCREHVETHSDERKYKCEVCTKGFKTARYLRHHKKRCLRTGEPKLTEEPEAVESETVELPKEIDMNVIAEGAIINASTIATDDSFTAFQ